MKVERRSLTDEICGQIFQKVNTSAAAPRRDNTMLRAKVDFCLRRILIADSHHQICASLFIRIMNSGFKQTIQIPHHPKMREID